MIRDGDAVLETSLEPVHAAAAELLRVVRAYQRREADSAGQHPLDALSIAIQALVAESITLGVEPQEAIESLVHATAAHLLGWREIPHGRLISHVHERLVHYMENPTRRGR